MDDGQDYSHETEPTIGSGNENGRQVMPVTSPTGDSRTISVRVPGLTEVASNCLIKALHLTKEFNHPEVSVAHFIVAMTLVPRANRQFSVRHLDAESAWRASMTALTDMERLLSGPSGDPPLSVELITVLNDASRNAENRDNQETSVDDILATLSRLPLEASARKMIQGLRPITPAEEARDAVRRLEETVVRRIDILSEAMHKSPQLGQEPSGPNWLRGIASQLGGRR
jgi:ATP-dependent Clp protease ATP-binding subunit ClpA